MDLNKKALAEAIAESNNITKKLAAEIVDSAIATIVETLKEGNKVDLFGLGKFEVKTRAARQTMNPRTREVVDVPETRVPSFKASKALKDALK